MPKIDWKNLENTYSVNYIRDGVHKTTVKEVVIKDATPSGSYPIEFIFDDVDEGKLPKATHWLTFKPGKEGWRQHHLKQLMLVLGVSEKWAEEAIEKIEDGATSDKIADGYQAALSKCASKRTEVEVECWEEMYTKKDGSTGKASRAEFVDRRVNMGHDEPKTSAAATAVDEFGVEPSNSDAEVDLSDIPF